MKPPNMSLKKCSCKAEEWTSVRPWLAVGNLSRAVRSELRGLLQLQKPTCEVTVMEPRKQWQGVTYNAHTSPHAANAKCSGILPEMPGSA